MHTNEIREDTFCPLCNTIEDEDHFLLLCADNADLRNKFTPYSFEDYSINYHNLDENGKKTNNCIHQHANECLLHKNH
jgi:hypothetical protein